MQSIAGIENGGGNVFGSVEVNSYPDIVRRLHSTTLCSVGQKLLSVFRVQGKGAGEGGHR